MQASTELLQTLSEVGYLACFRGDGERSERIMDGVSAIGREQIPIKMGVAISRLYVGKYDEAINILQNDILQEDPNHMSAKCFLGIALMQTGQESEARVYLEEVARLGNPDESGIASAYLEVAA